MPGPPAGAGDDVVDLDLVLSRGLDLELGIDGRPLALRRLLQCLESQAQAFTLFLELLDVAQLGHCA